MRDLRREPARFAPPRAVVVDHFDCLAPDNLLQNRPEPFVQRRLEDAVFVGIDRAFDDVFAQAVGGIDQHRVAKSGLGIDGEDDAGSGEIGANHALHADGKRDLLCAKPLSAR